jgi:hypothetical protein
LAERAGVAIEQLKAKLETTRGDSERRGKELEIKAAEAKLLRVTV